MVDGLAVICVTTEVPITLVTKWVGVHVVVGVDDNGSGAFFTAPGKLVLLIMVFSSAITVVIKVVIKSRVAVSLEVFTQLIYYQRAAITITVEGGLVMELDTGAVSLATGTAGGTGHSRGWGGDDYRQRWGRRGHLVGTANCPYPGTVSPIVLVFH